MSKKSTLCPLIVGPIHSFQEEEINIIKKSLLKWYYENHRNLPWRTIAKTEVDYNKRAYAVWVSEIMCQQTQVATVIDYYNRWMSMWPTVDMLAKATLEEINKIWAGLGYYSRAKRLHEGAIKITEELKGEFPQGRDRIQKELPGVGRYTASAIASISSKEPVGVVDGNVLRVMTRLRAIGSDISSQIVIDEIWKLSDLLVDKDEPGDSNQAIMELGAIVCTPKNPSCSSCPLKKNCKAFSLKGETSSLKTLIVSQKENNVQTSFTDIECVPNCGLCLKKSDWNESLGVQNFPRKYKKTSVKNKISAVVVLKREGKRGTEFLLIQRPKTGLLANLWEFVNVPLYEESKNAENASEFTESAKDEKLFKETMEVSLKEDFSLPRTLLKSINFISDVTHIFSHIHQIYKVYEARDLESDSEICYPECYQDSRWMSEEEFMSCATSTAMKKVFKAYKTSISAKGKSSSEKRKRVSSIKSKEDDVKQRKMSHFFRPIEQKK